MSGRTPPPKKPGMSLYADLLNPDQHAATISGAPVRYEMKKEADEEVQKKKDASLKFQPIKRPQVQQKAKPKGPPTSSSHKFSSSTATLSASSPEKQLPGSTPHQQPNVQLSKLEDWVGDEDEDSYYQEQARSRGRKKKNKKNNQYVQETRTLNWDDIYDPTQPNVFLDYKGSDEQIRENRDWKARLYYHMRDTNGRKKNDAAGSDKDREPSRPMNRMFAPPSNMSFAPPSFNGNVRPSSSIDDEDDYSYGRRGSNAYDTPSTHPPPPVDNDATGKDAYMRRQRMSGMVDQSQAAPSPPAPPPAPQSTAVPIPPNSADPDLEAKRAAAQEKIAAFKAKLLAKSQKSDAPAAAPPQIQTQQPAPAITAQQTPPPPPPPPPMDEPASTISRAPVRYDKPPPPPESATEGGDTELEAEQPRTNRPGKKGFAERLLKKYGWEKGRGLGAQGDGITTALVGKADKRAKLPDSAGGGWAQPANMGKIVGGKRRKLEDGEAAEQADPRFGAMSDVIKLKGMLKGLDVQKEIEENDLMQEIGDEMSGSYGNVERVFIWRESMGGSNEVFVKFNSQLSALRAVNGMDGVTFAGNEVVARFWDSEKYAREEYA